MIVLSWLTPVLALLIEIALLILLIFNFENNWGGIIWILSFKFLAVGCRTDGDCPTKEGCVNGRCQDPSLPKEPVVGECPPCQPNEECDATTLTCFPGKFRLLFQPHAVPLTIKYLIVDVVGFHHVNMIDKKSVKELWLRFFTLHKLASQFVELINFGWKIDQIG